ncbi:MAG: hypothetical protein CVT73_00970, partial [Alphaproteobacteria bacterium HGW-Alphaproteobacteria-12]
MAFRGEPLDADMARLAAQCVLDWIAVTIAGASEPCADILAGEFATQNPGDSPLVGRNGFARPMDAVLINGTASHALDYDDVNSIMPGHPTVPLLPAVLGLGVELGKSGAEVVQAFVAGYEAQCQIGHFLNPSHYANGFHSTGTIGTLGAAVGAGTLLGLDALQMANAIGLAAAQAAGLKSMFGTMAKPFQAGKAAVNGLLAARLAARGFTASTEAIEASQGLVDTLSDEVLPPAVDFGIFGKAIARTLFKYHAACYITHSAIEATRVFVENHPAEVPGIISGEIHVGPNALKICNIQTPRTGLETKFSLRHVVSMVLAGKDTTSFETFSDENAHDASIIAFRDRVQVIPDLPDGTAARMKFHLMGGEVVEIAEDVGVPATDLAAQEAKLSR